MHLGGALVALTCPLRYQVCEKELLAFGVKNLQSIQITFIRFFMPTSRFTNVLRDPSR